MSLLAEQKICKQERFAPERGCLLSFNFTETCIVYSSFCAEWSTILISVQSYIIVLVLSVRLAINICGIHGPGIVVRNVCSWNVVDYLPKLFKNEMRLSG
jgi:hypothetical protein